MNTYLKVFQTTQDYQTYINGEDVVYPNVCYVVSTGVVYFNSSQGEATTTLKDFLEREIVEVEVPEGTTKIGEYAFYHWTNITDVTIPDSVVEVGKGAFTYCNSLPYENSVRYADNVAIEVTNNSTTTISIKSGTRLLQDFFGDSARNVINITLPNSLEKLSQYAFNQCNKIKTINSNVEGECIIPSGVTSIGANAFSTCTGLTTVTIPSGVESIGNNAFYGCRSLVSITVEATTPPTLGTDVFVDNASGRKIYVPSASVSAYQSASGWSTYASIIEPIQI